VHRSPTANALSTELISIGSQRGLPLCGCPHGLALDPQRPGASAAVLTGLALDPQRPGASAAVLNRLALDPQRAWRSAAVLTGLALDPQRPVARRLFSAT
jgi:hypothetical protein